MRLEDIVQEFEHSCLDNLKGCKRGYKCTVCSKVVSPFTQDKLCCGEVRINEKDGEHVCYKCGLVVQGYLIEGMGETSNDFIRDFNPRKRRHYHPYIHFNTHLKRYLGDVDLQIEDKYLNEMKSCINVRSPNAYEDVRKYLKKQKLSDNYKAIYRIIYDLGGNKPVLTSVQYEGIKNDFMNLQTFFLNNSGKYCAISSGGMVVKQRESLGKFNRKSIPCLSMLLDILLRKNGHVPFYNIPQLKDADLRQRVLDFYECHRKNNQNPWSLSETSK